MKYLMFVVFLLCVGCKKSKNNPTPSQSIQSVADKIGLKFEQPYQFLLYSLGFTNPEIDTVIFHSNNTITENYKGNIYTYFSSDSIVATNSASILQNGLSINVYDTSKNNYYKGLISNYSGGGPGYSNYNAVIGVYLSGNIPIANQPTLGISFANYSGSPCYGILKKL